MDSQRRRVVRTHFCRIRARQQRVWLRYSVRATTSGRIRATMNPLKRTLMVLLMAAPLSAQAPSTRNLVAPGAAIAPGDYEAVRQAKIVTAVRITDRINVDGQLE